MLAETLDDDDADIKPAALDLIARGLHVLTVKQGEKRPDPLLAPNGFRDATSDAEVAAGWWRVKPNANIGVACGPDYGVVVLDVDVKGRVNGIETLAEMGVDLATLIADTPSGGFHIYFKHPGVPLPATRPGIDIKGGDGGGYVLAPPSTLSNGTYRWRDAEMPIAPFPQELLSKLTARATSAPRAVGPAAALIIPEGRRHARLVELGAIYRGKGLSPDDVETLLWAHSARYFSPPFSRDDPEHVKEVQAVVHWFGGKAGREACPGELLVLTTSELIERALQISDRTLLDPILPEAGNLMIYGPTGVGKSHLATVIALALGRGSSVLGWFAAEPVPVLFCDGEMPLPELAARLAQYLAGSEPPESLRWVAARAQDADMPNLADPAAQTRYSAAIAAHGARVVVFDNLSCLRTTTAESPENSSEAWQPIADFLRRLNRLGVATVTVHHSAKSGTQRGSSAHTAVMDNVLSLRLPGEGQADPLAELDVEIVFEKHRRIGNEAAQPIRAKVIVNAEGFACWQACGPDPLAEDVARLVKQGRSIRHIAGVLQRSKAGVEKAKKRAQARGLLPLGGPDE